MSASIHFREKLKIQHPIIQAPMAGGGDTPDLVAAVSNAGGLGFFGAAYLSPLQIAEFAEAVRLKTSGSFGINLFAPTPAPPADLPLEEALQRLRGYYSELGLEAPSVPAKPDFAFAEQLAAALETGASAFSFTFGILREQSSAAIKAKGMFLMGTATTVAEAVELERAGVDAVVTQGSEAGGHRGTFSGDFAAAMIGTMALVPQVVDAVEVPVIASGGIMDGRASPQRWL